MGTFLRHGIYRPTVKYSTKCCTYDGLKMHARCTRDVRQINSPANGKYGTSDACKLAINFRVLQKRKPLQNHQYIALKPAD